MKAILLCLCLIGPSLGYAQSPAEPSQVPEPILYDHYVFLKRMQESLAARPLEEQARLQPQIQRAEQRACERLRKERHEGVPKESYRRQGGDEFFVFAQQFDQYCETLR